MFGLAWQQLRRKHFNGVQADEPAPATRPTDGSDSFARRNGPVVLFEGEYGHAYRLTVLKSAPAIPSAARALDLGIAIGQSLNERLLVHEPLRSLDWA
jgi:hypothetical protein